MVNNLFSEVLQQGSLGPGASGPESPENLMGRLWNFTWGPNWFAELGKV